MIAPKEDTFDIFDNQETRLSRIAELLEVSPDEAQELIELILKFPASAGLLKKKVVNLKKRINGVNKMTGKLMYPGYFTTQGLRFEDYQRWTIKGTPLAQVPISKLTKITAKEAKGRPVCNIFKILDHYQAISLSKEHWDWVIRIKEKAKD